MKTYCILFCFLLSTNFIHSQNLVLNPDFESFSACPMTYDDFPVVDWISPTAGTSDYLNACNIALFGVPSNFIGFQNSNTGNAYLGLIMEETINFDSREYAQTTLPNPLIPGCYNIELHFSCPEESSFADKLGVLVSDGPPSSYFTDPQLELDFMPNNHDIWYVLTTDFISEGGENTLTIGNFRDDINTNVDMQGGTLAHQAYVYIDYVSLTFNGDFPLAVDLGEDVILCEADYPYTITTNFPGKDHTWSNGSNNNEITVTGPGTYAVSIIDGCENGKDSITISSYDSNVFFNLGPDQTVCEGNVVTIFLDPDLGVYEWEDGSNSTEYLISEVGNYAVTLTHDCGVIIDDIQINFSPNLFEFSINDIFTCESDFPIKIDVTDEIEGFNVIWSNGMVSNIGSFDSAADYSVNLSNDCYDYDFDFEIALIENVYQNLDLGEDISVCPGDSLILTSNITENIMWNTGIDSTSISVDTPGIFIATFQDNCSLYTDTIQVSHNGVAPIIDLPDSIFLCPGDTVILTPSLNPSGQTFEWNTGSIDPHLIVDTGGWYMVSVSNSCGEALDSAYLVLGVKAPVSDLQDKYEVCPGGNVILSLTTITDILWSTGDIDGDITLENEGIYWVELSNECAIIRDSFEIIFLDEIKPFNLIDDFGICENDSVLIPGPIIVAYHTWSNGDTTQDIIVTNPGVYTLTISNACNEQIDTVIVSDLGGVPSSDLVDLYEVCPGDNVSLLLTTIADILWSTGDIEDAITLENEGIYWVELSNQCAIIRDSFEIVFLDEIEPFNLTDDFGICQMDSVLIKGPAVIADYNWSTGDTSQDVTINQPGVYILNLSNGCNEQIDTVVVSDLGGVPKFDLGPDVLFCKGTEIELSIGDIEYIDINWSTGQDSEIIKIDQPGVYYVEVINECGSGIDTIKVDHISALPLWELPADQIVCEDNFVINPSAVILEGDYIWNDGSGLPQLIATESGLYTLEISNECESSQKEINLEFLDAPIPFMFENEEICEGDTVILDGYQGSSFNYKWQDNSVASTFAAFESGLYELVVSNTCGEERNQIEINVYEIENFGAILDIDYEICEGEEILLDLSELKFEHLIWEDGSSEVQRLVREAKVYSAQIFNLCSDSIVIFNVDPKLCLASDIYIPNAFTPNEDGNNDIFSIQTSPSLNVLSFKVFVFDRFGNKVYNSFDVNFSWNGKSNGILVTSGVYVYLINMKSGINGKTTVLSRYGDLTLLR